MPAYYADTVGDFLSKSPDNLQLTLHNAYESDRYKDLITTQIAVWRTQIQTLKNALTGVSSKRLESDGWGVAIEFVIPRKMGRIDNGDLDW